MSEWAIVGIIIGGVFVLRVSYEIWDWHVARVHEKQRRADEQANWARYHKLYKPNASQEALDRYERHNRREEP